MADKIAATSEVATSRRKPTGYARAKTKKSLARAVS
jgi:hypothetical protein